MKLEDASPPADLTWDLRVSRRARYAKLQIRPFGGLEVVIPPRFPRHQVAGLVAKHANWVRHQLATQSALRASVRLPEVLKLAFDQSSTRVIYQHEPLQYSLDLFDLELFAQADNGAIVIEASEQSARIGELRQWIRCRARATLPVMFREVSLRTGLVFNKLSIRSQKSRWGSCSARGNINLNDQLMFLQRNTVEYLMVHELCHTRQLNHSKAFWGLVKQHCPEYREHEKVLADSRNLVPDWFLLDLYS
jgi:predicted metal-dependent hydrolase